MPIRHCLLCLLALAISAMAAPTTDDLDALRDEVRELRDQRERINVLMWAKERYVTYAHWLLHNEARELERAEAAWRDPLVAWIEAQKSARDAMQRLLVAIEADEADAAHREELRAQARTAEDYVRLADMRYKAARDAASFAAQLEARQVADAEALVERFRQLTTTMADTQEAQISGKVRLERLNEELRDLRDTLQQRLRDARQ